MVATRKAPVVLAEKVAVIVPLLLPLVGDTASHETLSVTVQVVLEVTAKVVAPEEQVTFLFDGVTDSVEAETKL